MKAALQLPARCRDELKSSPPAVLVRTQPGRSVEKCRGEDENREERPRHGTTKSAVKVGGRLVHLVSGKLSPAFRADLWRPVEAADSTFGRCSSASPYS